MLLCQCPKVFRGVTYFPFNLSKYFSQIRLNMWKMYCNFNYFQVFTQFLYFYLLYSVLQFVFFVISPVCIFAFLLKHNFLKSRTVVNKELNVKLLGVFFPSSYSYSLCWVSFRVSWIVFLVFEKFFFLLYKNGKR